jgi:hypothetical protein
LASDPGDPPNQKNATVILGEVTGVDKENKRIFVSDADRLRVPLSDDLLILATGASHSYFGHDEFGKFKPGIKSHANEPNLAYAIYSKRHHRMREIASVYICTRWNWRNRPPFTLKDPDWEFTVWHRFIARNTVSEEGVAMANPRNLGELVKRYGYAKQQKVKLYGKELELVSDPILRGEDNVFVNAREEGSHQVREVQVPQNVVAMAKNSRSWRE